MDSMPTDLDAPAIVSPVAPQPESSMIPGAFLFAFLHCRVECNYQWSFQCTVHGKRGINESKKVTVLFKIHIVYAPKQNERYSRRR
jgi:hypothetical protein